MQLDKKSKKQIHFIVPYAFDLAPGQRYRFEQYIPFLKEQFEISFHYFFDVRTYKILYKTAHFQKVIGVLTGYLRRAFYLLKISRGDYIFIFRESTPFGNTVYERILRYLTPGKLIFDFDDAIWLPDKNSANKKLAFLKNPQKTDTILTLTDKVVAGNQYLADYALRYNKNVTIIPTTIDTDWYQPVTLSDKPYVCIGWSGSFTTVKHFETVLPALSRIKQKYGEKVRFKLIGDSSYKNVTLELKGIAWKSATEVEDLKEIDIGIMPLPNDEWSKGKCGLKGLQYMGMAIPTVMSPVGVNTDIIDDGENGFLADSEDEWVDKLSQLIEDKMLRTRIGISGRKTVVDNYSVEANKHKYLELFS